MYSFTPLKNGTFSLKRLMQLLQFLEALVWMVTVARLLALPCAVVTVVAFVVVVVLLCAAAPISNSRAIMVTSSFFIFCSSKIGCKGTLFSSLQHHPHAHVPHNAGDRGVNDGGVEVLAEGIVRVHNRVLLLVVEHVLRTRVDLPSSELLGDLAI